MRAKVSLLTLALAVAVFLSITVGASDATANDILSALFGSSSNEAEIIARLRVLRTLGAASVGAALGVAGAILQTLTRNPLADPGIVGINSASALAVLMGFTFFHATTSLGIGISAGIGASVGALILLGLNERYQGNPVSLTLAGVALAAVFTTAYSFLLITSPGTFDAFKSWSLGNLQAVIPERLVIGVAMIAAGLVVAIATIRGLGVVELGVQHAQSMGLSRVRFSLLVAVTVALTAGGASAIAGPVMFVGLAAPHLARLLIGHQIGRLMVGSAVIGSLFVLIADVLARVLHQTSEVPLSVVLGLIGAPALILLLRRAVTR